MTLKKNVSVFNQDVSTGAGYKYTQDARPSVRIANDRMTRGIREAFDFNGKRVLDIGCGDGTFTMALLEMGAATIDAMDPAERAVEAGRAKAVEAGVEERVRFRVYNVYDLGSLTERYDVVVVRGVLHHLPDAAQAVKEIAKVADEIVILEPNGANPALKLIERFSRYHVEHEEQSFLPSTVDRWLQEAGAAIQYRKLINLVPIFCPSLAARGLKAVEPIVEAVPGLRVLGCGQYVVRGKVLRAEFPHVTRG